MNIPMKMTPQRRALDKIYKRRDRYEIPEWQRENVWDTAKNDSLSRRAGYLQR